MKKNTHLVLFICFCFTVHFSAVAQPDLNLWTAKFLVTHLNGIDSDTVWFGCDTAGGPGFQQGLDIIDTNFTGRIRILAYDAQLAADSAFGTCVNLERDIKAFQTGYTTFTFYVLSDSAAGEGIGKLSWDSTYFIFENDSFSLDEALLESEYGYLEAIDGDLIGIAALNSDSTMSYRSGNINIYSDGFIFECNSNLYLLKLNLTVLWNYYQYVGINELLYRKKYLKVFPNPVSDHLIIETPEPIINGTLEIININGVIMFQTPVSNNSNIVINTEDILTPGFYITRVINLPKNEIYFGKFIVSP
jgi:hypothetical protein